MAEGGAHGVWPLLQVLLAADDEGGAHGSWPLLQGDWQLTVVALVGVIVLSGPPLSLVVSCLCCHHVPVCSPA